MILAEGVVAAISHLSPGLDQFRLLLRDLQQGKLNKLDASDLEVIEEYMADALHSLRQVEGIANRVPGIALHPRRD